MLNIAGFEKISLIDYPGKLSAIVFTYGCNLKCEYCHNPELVIEPLNEFRLLDKDKILRYLGERKGKLDAVVITGGEPLLYKDLKLFVKKIKALGYLVKLDTNGLLPNRLQEYIKLGLLDYISMDIKYSPNDYIQYTGEDAFTNVKETIKIIMSSGLEYEFRTTYVKGIHGLNSSKEIAQMIEGAQLYFIQNFRSGKTINPALSAANSFTETELKKLKNGAKPYVKHVEIR
jgi:pyruvate formate lyase activating enzyme